MAHNVFFGKTENGNVIHIAQHTHRILQTRASAVRQINLRDVACDDHFGVEAETRQEHFHLLAGGVLRLIQNDKAVVERSAAHVRKRRHLNAAALHKAGIRVIFDAVYNHTFDIDGSNFQRTYPDYYYRKTADGRYSNGSGCASFNNDF